MAIIKTIVETAGKAVAGAVGTAAGVAAGAAESLTTARSAPPPKVEPANEELYWREHFAAEPYYDPAFDFEEYLPAWRTGWEGRAKYVGRRFEDVERELQSDYQWNRGQSRLLWDQARAAVRAGFEH